MLGSGAALLPVSKCNDNYRMYQSAFLRGASEYQSTLVDGFTPGHVYWAGRKWRCAMGSTWNPDMDYAFRLSSERARFEIREAPLNRGVRDKINKRRSEIRHPNSPRLPNGVPLWGAMSFAHHQWDDPAGMAANRGGVHGQLHMGSAFGGSPALAFRRTRKGAFAITTRGERDPDGTLRYEGPLSFDAVHNLVYRMVLGPNSGTLQVWLNGDSIVQVKDISIGSEAAQCYWGIGCYYTGTITCPIIAEYGDHVYPSPTDLQNRIGFRPMWQASP